MMDKVTDRLCTEGARERIRVEMHEHIKDIMHRIAGDPLMLNEVVACGPFDWRRKFKKAMGVLPVTDEIANAVFAFFEQKAGGRYAATQFMNAVEITIETDAERAKKIEENWMLTSHSSEAAKRAYGMPTGDGPMKLKDIRGLLKVSDYAIDKLPKN